MYDNNAPIMYPTCSTKLVKNALLEIVAPSKDFDLSSMTIKDFKISGRCHYR